MLRSVGLLVLALSVCFALEFPSYITKCNEDKVDKCFVDAANVALAGFLPGDKRYGIPSFFPLELGNTEINERQMKLKMRNCQLRGFETMRVIKMEWVRPVGRIGFTIDQLSLTGNFPPGAKLFDVTMPYAGTANLTLNNVLIYLNLIFKNVKVADYEHRITPFKVTFDIEPKTTFYSFKSDSGETTAIIDNSKTMNEMVLPKFHSALLYGYLNSGARIVTMFPLESFFFPKVYSRK